MRINKTLKIIFFTLLFLGISSLLFRINVSATTRPYYGWTKTIGGTGNEFVASMTIDSERNLYTAGSFSSSNLEFNSTGAGSSDIKSTAGGNDIFVTKYNSNGSYGWTRTIGGTSADTLRSITSDNDGNVYFAGQFGSSNVEFNTTGTGSSDIKSTAGGLDAFITKYNSNGSYAWTRIISGSSAEFITSVTTDGNGNIYFAGSFISNNVNFNTTGAGSSDIHSTNGSNDIFITKYNNDGSYGWTNTIGGTGVDQALSIAIDNNGNIYFTGLLGSSNVEFNTTGSGNSDIKSTVGGFDAYITKYNSDSSYAWTRTIGGTATEQGSDVTTDSDGNIYFVGAFGSSNLDFNTTGSGSTDIKSSAGVNDMFTTKYNSNGSYAWTRTIGGTSNEFVNRVNTDSDGNIYIAAQFASSNMEFNTTGSGNSDLKSSAGLGDISITKYNNDSSYAWTIAIGGTAAENPGSIITNSGNVYFAGQFQSSNIEFNTTGFGSSDIKSSSGLQDIFITQLINTEIEVGLLESGVSSDGSISVNEGSNGTYEVVLNAEPSDDVIITLTYGSGITVSPTSLTFTASNWNIPQTVTVSAVNDDVVSGNRSVTISHTVTSNDSLYNGILVPDMMVNIIEDDIATTSTGKKASVGAGVGLGNGTGIEVELEEESEEENEITITPTPTKTVKPTNLPETGKDGQIKGSVIKFTTVALCSLPLIIVVIVMIIAARRKKKKNEN